MNPFIWMLVQWTSKMCPFHISKNIFGDRYTLMMHLKYNFYTLSKTLIACRAMQLRFFKVETLLNTAFNLQFKQDDS